jgi:hypothetical protein
VVIAKYHATEKLAEFIEKLDYSDCNAGVIAAAKASLLDFIGVAIAGSRAAQLNGLLMDSLVRFDGSDECTILGESKIKFYCPGENRKTPPQLKNWKINFGTVSLISGTTNKKWQ